MVANQINLTGGVLAHLEPGERPTVRFEAVPGQNTTQSVRAEAVLRADLHDEALQLLPDGKVGRPYALPALDVSALARAIVTDADLARSGHFRVVWVAVGGPMTGR